MLFAAGMEKENFVDVVIPTWGWPMLLVVVAGALMIDLLIFHRKAHVIEIREAAIESAVWIGLGLAFTGVVAWMFAGQGEGTSSAVEFGLNRRCR
jgi:tellurite resistance protein TerC